MKQMRLVGLCLVVAAALSAVVASAAFATAPEYGRCTKAEKNVKKEYNGSFSEAKCEKEVPVAERAKKGKYIWTPGAGKAKFTTTGGVGVLTTVGGSGVECKTESSSGEFAPGTNKEETGVVVKFNECISLGLYCNTPGAKSGELVTNELDGLVGWENKASKKTDLELFPAPGVKGGLFIEFECSGLAVKVKGHVLVPIKNGKMTATETLKFKAIKGKQKPEKWEESGSPAILEAAFSNFKGGAYEQAGQNITSTVKGEEELELNPVI
jgi:hypothetical protein